MHDTPELSHAVSGMWETPSKCCFTSHPHLFMTLFYSDSLVYKCVYPSSVCAHTKHGFGSSIQYAA